LFAALNILEPLYEACLERMQAFLEDLAYSGERHRPEKFSDFRKTLDEVNQHPNRRYFILKSIVVNNLFGVDIMEEAVEICKLRLFLKLVAQVESVRRLEPLPDIDFNIRAGNTLVGFVTVEEVRKAASQEVGGQGRLVFGETDEAIRKIEEDAEIVERAFQKFHEMQTRQGMDAKDFAEAKGALRAKLKVLADQLDRYLAKEYKVDPGKAAVYESWRSSHQPFHWFAEFFGIMRNGGFNVIVGNPPYVEKSKLGGQYKILGYKTDKCRDIYAWVVERSVNISAMSGCIGLIVPVSVASSGSFSPLRDLLENEDKSIWLSHFANRPGQLFSGAQNRLTIMIRIPREGGERVFSTRYHRWDARNGERESLLDLLEYVGVDVLGRAFEGLFAKVGVPQAVSILRKLAADKSFRDYRAGADGHPLYWVRVPGYFCQFFLEPPMATPEDGGPPRVRGEVLSTRFNDMKSLAIAHCVLNGSIWYQFYSSYSDGRHINPSDVLSFPFKYENVSDKLSNSLISMSEQMNRGMKENTSLWRKSGLLIESVDSASCKETIDSIDVRLADYYTISDDDLDYAINYDVKYRLRGKGGSEDDG
jgi:hypothetical protein